MQNKQKKWKKHILNIVNKIGKKVKWRKLGVPNWSFEKINKNLSSKTDQKWREKIQMITISHEREDVTTELAGIKSMIREYYIYHCVHQLDTLDDINTSLERHK